ncbi:MAG: nucleotidyltransferase domain-containing protein [Gammaproteobacteria bacterium]|nr:nucleotidyltransferase domain-containing protein [Gammaproteobacteria bacterium]
MSTDKRAETRENSSRQSSLADALFTSTQQRVLAPLFGQPGKSFFVTQIMRLANSGRGAVQRELERLRVGGLVNVKMVGTQKHYQANPESPLFDELCSIVQKTVGLKEPLLDAIASLPMAVQFAAVYGSVAKGTETSSSDVDLMVVSDGLVLEELYAAIAPAEDLLSRRINPTLYTPSEFDRRRESGNAFLSRVLDGPLIILAGSIDDV